MSGDLKVVMIHADRIRALFQKRRAEIIGQYRVVMENRDGDRTEYIAPEGQAKLDELAEIERRLLPCQ